MTGRPRSVAKTRIYGEGARPPRTRTRFLDCSYRSGSGSAAPTRSPSLIWSSSLRRHGPSWLARNRCRPDLPSRLFLPRLIHRHSPPLPVNSSLSRQAYEDLLLSKEDLARDLEIERLKLSHVERERDAFSAAYETSLTHFDKWMVVRKNSRSFAASMSAINLLRKKSDSKS